VAEATRWGILSTARINRWVLDDLRKSDAVSVVAVASRDRARAEAYGREHGIERAYGTYDELLADQDVEAVYVSAPNHLHHEWTMRSLAAGKHVLCEKPYSRRPGEVEEAFAAAEQAGLVLSEGYMWRHNPQTRLLLSLLPRIGTLQTVRATFCVTNTDLTNFRLRPELDGGSLMDLGCYCLSAARLLAGEPRRVSAEQVIGDTGAEVRMTAVLRFEGDVLAEFTSSFFADHESLHLIGADGSLSVPDPWHCLQGVVLVNGEEHRVDVRSRSYLFEFENVAGAIRGETEPLLGREDAVGQARAIEALYRSAAGGVFVVPAG
jgi:D-xylose 1-dehydrogenase (NADP+, D-xylono-1,5-lactone-forming)